MRAIVGWAAGFLVGVVVLALIPGNEPTPIPFFAGMGFSAAGIFIAEATA